MMAKAPAKKESSPPTSDAVDANTIDVTGGPVWMVGGTDPKTGKTLTPERVAKIYVRPMSFVEWVACVKVASVGAADGGYQKQYQRQRRKSQIRALSVTGINLPLTDFDLSSMPRQYGIAAQQIIESMNEPEGKVLNAGDGVSTPFHVELGTPLRLTAGGGEKVQISELEFMAKTLGDVEDALAEVHPAARALALVRRCAKPILPEEHALLRLSDGMIANMTIMDGLLIMEKVLPAFLSEQGE